MKSNLLPFLLGTWGAFGVILCVPAHAQSEQTVERSTGVHYQRASMSAATQTKLSTLRGLRAEIRTLESEAQQGSDPRNDDGAMVRSPTLEDRVANANLRAKQRQAARLESELRAELFPDNGKALADLQNKLALAKDGGEREALETQYKVIRAILADEEESQMRALLGE